MPKSWMRYIAAFSLAVLTSLTSAQTSRAVAVSAVPNPQQFGEHGWVSDTAELLSPRAEQYLNQLIDRFQRTTDNKIFVVTVPSTRPSRSALAFATDLFNRWEIGQPEGKGVLLLIARDERRVELKPGYGVSHLLSGDRRTLLKKYVTPRFKRKEFDAGTTAGVKQIMAMLDGADLARDAPDSHSIPPQIIAALLGGFFFLVMPGFFVWIVLRARRYSTRDPLASLDNFGSHLDCAKPLFPVGHSRAAHIPHSTTYAAFKTDEQCGWMPDSSVYDTNEARGDESSGSDSGDCDFGSIDVGGGDCGGGADYDSGGGDSW
ncbi:TPM domain-containing protein [filamentous cyanobacterium LEGE 11480]|uniref:TPM domain-containing protein n=1 Tax=Romeriopsis navalis LEGE 11480 TaxID=2777977 RepID=A0A928Z5X0_9CYAN|nr:TPM domain-containing protein [Romeriopsis navalis]MBE9031700.1 TPM domain-containing protein [Romeriopsis navalis LEGE 11480]